VEIGSIFVIGVTVRTKGREGLFRREGCYSYSLLAARVGRGLLLLLLPLLVVDVGVRHGFK
jgi:hypothetical protein